MFDLPWFTTVLLVKLPVCLQPSYKWQHVSLPKSRTLWPFCFRLRVADLFPALLMHLTNLTFRIISQQNFGAQLGAEGAEAGVASTSVFTPNHCYSIAIPCYSYCRYLGDWETETGASAGIRNSWTQPGAFPGKAQSSGRSQRNNALGDKVWMIQGNTHEKATKVLVVRCIWCKNKWIYTV